MPDIISVISKRWKLIFLLTGLATLLALAITLLLPKLYLSTVTAVPTNSALNDKARLFNQNIEGLYPELGSPDELDRMEGTAKLDTLYVAMAKEFKLAEAYHTIDEKDPDFRAALLLKKNLTVVRSAYGQLKINVWDKEPDLAAKMANTFLQKLNEFHQHLQNENNQQLLKRMKEDMAAKQNELATLQQSLSSYTGSDLSINKNPVPNDSMNKPISRMNTGSRARELSEQINASQTVINQYEIFLKTVPNVLVVEEAARPSLEPDKPRVLSLAFFAFFAALLFSTLLAFFVEGRNKTA